MGTGGAVQRRGARRPSPRGLRALAPRPVGWRTTDADEIALRRERASSELMQIKPLETSEPIFATFEVGSPSGACYEVEVRSLCGARELLLVPRLPHQRPRPRASTSRRVLTRLRRTPAGDRRSSAAAGRRAWRSS